MNSETNMSPTPHEPPSSGKTARVTIAILVLMVTAVLALIGVPWMTYRHSHVVVDDAVVKGTITKLGARLDGQVKAILVDVGQHVSQGQVLLRLEDQHLLAARQRAQAELEVATNELRSERLAIEADRRRLTLEVERAGSIRESAAATIEGAKSTAERLASDYTRTVALAKDGIAASSDLDRITGERGKAMADVKAASSMRDAAVSGFQTAQVQLESLQVREARLGIIQAQVSIAQAKIAAAEADLEAAVIRAPDNGWVVNRIVEVGGSAKVGEPMLELWTGRPWIEAWASEKLLRRMTVGSEVDISLDAYPGRRFRGRIETFGLLTDKELQNKPVPSTLNALIRKGAMVPVRIALETDNLRLQPGLSALVGIEKSPVETGPSEAVAYSRASARTASLVSRAP